MESIKEITDRWTNEDEDKYLEKNYWVTVIEHKNARNEIQLKGDE